LPALTLPRFVQVSYQYPSAFDAIILPDISLCDTLILLILLLIFYFIADADISIVYDMSATIFISLADGPADYDSRATQLMLILHCHVLIH